MHSLFSDSNGQFAQAAILQLEYFVWLLNRMPCGAMPGIAISAPVELDDDMPLVKRVMDSYKLSMNNFQASSSPWDTALFDIKKEITDALSGQNIGAAAEVLRQPASNPVFGGFDAIASSPNGEMEPHEFVLHRLNTSVDRKSLYALWLRDALISFAEVVGARRVAYPEIEMGQPSPFKYGIDEIIDELESVLGVELQFPNPFPKEFGLPSKRGVIGFRSVQSAYQAWRISQIANGDPDFKVMEIGAGLGRTAYFASLFGVKNYTIVDIPLTNAAQGYFLGRVLNPKQIQLYGEADDAPVKIIPSTAMDRGQTYDLIVNVDSWTELAPEVAKSYWEYARQVTHMVLSINHEFNAYTVRDLYKNDASVKAIRFPYCMRRGYIEEKLTWK